MTGIVGGTVDEEQLGRMVDALEYEPWYDAERFEVGAYGLGAQHHGETDPQGHTFWTDGKTAGAIDGAVSNLDELGWDVPTVFERLLRAPERTLAALEGPFTIAAVDADDDRVLLGTGRIGSRTPYYDATGNGLRFGSGLAPLLEVTDDPTLDLQGVSTLLLMGHMWSDTTLLEGVKALHPASLLEYRDGELTIARYWRPDFDPASPTDEYFFELLTRFRQSVARTAGSADGDVGLWLSGGLDSRMTANELERHRDGFDSIGTYTYDANPGGGINLRLAGQVAHQLEVPNETVRLDADRFLSVLGKAVDVTDGMVMWNTFKNLTAAFNVEGQRPDVLMEGLEGALVGHHLSRYHLTEPSSLVEAQYESEAALSADEVSGLLSASVDPLASFRTEAARIDASSVAEGAVEAHFGSYYSRLAHASNTIPRTQFGTRVPYADSDFLEHVAKLPTGWRMGSLPFTDGHLIYGVVKPKFRMIRALNADLAEIPYERSRVKPTRPFPLHVAGFYASTALANARSVPTYGGKSLSAEWYHSHEGFREAIDDLLDGACERSFFDADAIRGYHRPLRREEESNMTAISAVTTLELWLRRHLD